MRPIVLALLIACAPTTPALAQTDHVVGAIDASLVLLQDEIDAAPPGDFAIYFASSGGEVFTGLRFMLAMERAKTRGVRFVCTADLAASMGAVIYSDCDVRIAIPRALFLVHPVTTQAGGRARALREEARAAEAMTAALYRQIARVLNIPYAELARRATGDYWLDSEGARAIGLVQRVDP